MRNVRPAKLIRLPVEICILNLACLVRCGVEGGLRSASPWREVSNAAGRTVSNNDAATPYPKFCFSLLE